MTIKNITPSDDHSRDTGFSFESAFNIIRSLRGKNGCPWDLEQTAESLRSSLIEEAYETVDAINSGNTSAIVEELGDILLLFLLISYILEQEQQASVQTIIDGLSEKLIRRHPHVFGNNENDLKSSEEVKKQWDLIKKDTEGKKIDSLHQVAKHLPSLERAFKIQKKVAKLGFDWPDLVPVFEKISEETEEIKKEIDSPLRSEQKKQNLELEIGDLLFAVVNLSRKLKISPENALHRSNEKFAKRFHYVEEKMIEQGIEMKQDNLSIMDKFWDESKKTYK